MRGMLPNSEARMRMCIMRVAHRGRWTYRDWTRWNFLWKYFPWYAREMRYRGDFCIGQGCMHWFWENPDTKKLGYCSAAVSRTQHLMWQKELEEAEGLAGQLGQTDQAALLAAPAGTAPPRRTHALRTLAGISAWGAVVFAVYWLW